MGLVCYSTVVTKPPYWELYCCIKIPPLYLRVFLAGGEKMGLDPTANWTLFRSRKRRMIWIGSVNLHYCIPCISGVLKVWQITTNKIKKTDENSEHACFRVAFYFLWQSFTTHCLHDINKLRDESTIINWQERSLLFTVDYLWFKSQQLRTCFLYTCLHTTPQTRISC